MKHSYLIVGLVILALVLGSSSYVQAAPPPQDKGLVFVNAISVAGPWEPQIPNAFSLFRRGGWGYDAKVKAVGNQWVHVSIPNMYFMDNAFWNVSGVEFCGKSTNGATAKAIRMVVWSYGTSVGSQNITWVNNTNSQCYSIMFSPVMFFRDITISVLLKYTNITDTFTLLRAEVVTKTDK